MKTCTSMLRGINVSGQKTIPMAELKKLYESLGFKNVQTYIQSGNVIFTCPEKNVSLLKDKIEKKIQRAFGFEVLVFIRTPEDFKRVIDNTPFANKDIDRQYVTFLSEAPMQLPPDEINKAKDATEEFLISSKEIYLYCPNGYGRTKLSNGFFEKKLKVSATTRNWKTVLRLVEMASSVPV